VKKAPAKRAARTFPFSLWREGLKIIDGLACQPLRYPERYSDRMLAAELGLRLAGKPAGGGTLPPAPAGPPPRVIWVDAGDEVIVHLDSIQARALDGLLAVSIDLECDQTGRKTLVSVFATGKPGDPAGLVCTTDELPRGNALLAGRWGAAVQSALWSSLLGLVNDHARERALEPLGITAAAGALQLVAGQPAALQPAQPLRPRPRK
jgi:hypothetical protein